MLEVKDINLFYGAAQALRGVSIAAEPGKVTCVLGRNGVGKTSLLRAMVGQYPISSGAIVFDHHRLAPVDLLQQFGGLVRFDVGHAGDRLVDQ